MRIAPRLWSCGIVVGDFVLQAMFFVVFPDSNLCQISASPERLLLARVLTSICGNRMTWRVAGNMRKWPRRGSVGPVGSRGVCRSVVLLCVASVNYLM